MKNSGRVCHSRAEALGFNPGLVFTIIDNTHLTEKGILNLCNNLTQLILVTSNKNHPAYKIINNNLKIISYKDLIHFPNLFFKLKKEYLIEKITLQSAGTLNSILLRNNLIDKVSIVLATCLIGGKDTSSLIDGKSLVRDEELKNIKALKLVKVDILNDSYLHIQYEVI